MANRIPREEWAEAAYSEASSRVAKARLTRQRELNLSRRASLLALPPLDGLESLRSINFAGTHIADISELEKLPNLISLDLSATRVQDLIPISNAFLLERLHMGSSQVTDLSPLTALPRLASLYVQNFQGHDVAPIAKLTSLTNLAVGGRYIEDYSALGSLTALRVLSLLNPRIIDLGFISNLKNLISLSINGTEAVDISSVSTLSNLVSLSLSGMQLKNISPLSNLRNLKSLNLNFTNVSDITPLSDLISLADLRLMGSDVTDVSPLSKLKALNFLDLDSTPVKDLSPLAPLVNLIAGTRTRPGGLDFSNCPISDNELKGFSKLSNPERTTKAINYLRKQAGLPTYGESDDAIALEPEKDADHVIPLENVPSPFSFSLTAGGAISVSASSANWPSLPRATSERDHEQRLEACREVAADIIGDLSNHLYQARPEYLGSLKKYSSRLPTKPGDGNILLADAAARTLRNLFSADLDNLSPAFASSLKTFLEQHIGLRAFYPEIAAFYSDVQDGKLSSPLPLDAVDEFVGGVLEYTPSVFEATVAEAIGETVEVGQVSAGSDNSLPVTDSNQLRPPPDPLGEIEPRKARDFTVAGTINKLWEIFLTGEKINNAVGAWAAAGEKLGPSAKAIIKWLYEYIQSGGPPPH